MAGKGIQTGTSKSGIVEVSSVVASSQKNSSAVSKLVS
jgi:hypothetical protein